MTDTSTDATTQAKTFADFGVNPEICAALTDAGITSPFPIQELTLPLALAGADLIGQARTGTGKTLAFGIPLLQRVDTSLRKTQALVVVPTRELCFQVAEDLTKASVNIAGLDVVAVYGGKALEPQANAVEKGAQVVVGTPGRLLDLLRRGSLTLSGVQGLVLDEADEMLDLGFLPDVEQLIQATAEGRQTLLFSATMPSAVVALARRYMHKPTFLRADVEEIHVAPETKQHFFSCHRMDKPAVVARILTTPNRGLCVIFTRTKRMADVLAEELRERGVKAAPIHSDLRQEAREKALARFRKGTITVLVATEVAARGLDIDDVTHVVNYDCPDDEKMYLHRIGRTGRAGADGVAITMAVWNELARLEMIKKTLDIDEPTHEVFSTSPILDELFDLPPRDQVRRGPVQDDDEDLAEDMAQAKTLLTQDAEVRDRDDAGGAPTSGDGNDDQSGEDGRKRRRRGGRGRSRSGKAQDAGASETAPEAKPRAASDGKPAAEPARAESRRASTAGDDEEPGRRTRTRTRRVSARGEDEPRPAAKDDAPKRDAADQDGDDAADRVRVRRRTRTASGAAPAERPSRSTRATREDKAPARERQEREPARRERAEQPREERAPSRAGSSSRGRSERGARAGRDARSGGRDARGRGGRDRDRRPEQPDVDTETARGGARPVISRPLKVEHLP